MKGVFKMLKSKSKILLSIFTILVLTTSYCLATTEPAVTEAPAEGEILTTEAPADTTVDLPADDGSAANQGNEANAQWENADHFEIDSSVNVTKIIDGNAYIMGGNVTISNEIGGDVFVIADKLTINGGYIYSNLFAIANEITINGVVYDVYAACNKLNIEANGFVYRDLRVLADEINITGKVRRNAMITTNNLTFAEGATELIGGNLNYTSSKELEIPEGVVLGEVKFSQESENGMNVNPVVTNLLTLARNLILTLVVALVLIWLTPKFIEKLGEVTPSKAFSAFGIGILAPICLFIVSAILLFSIVGIPLSGIITIVFVLLLYIGKSITSIFFGKIFVRKLKMEGNFKLVLFTLLSCLIIWLLGLIPVIGFILNGIYWILGIGLIFISLFDRKKAEVKEVQE